MGEKGLRREKTDFRGRGKGVSRGEDGYYCTSRIYFSAFLLYMVI